jgi:hypothetical protein
MGLTTQLTRTDALADLVAGSTQGVTGFVSFEWSAS